ncbi:hypothetical protein G6F57_022547 [Rhizopus arrhizus]|nr:hypothetical protein G6F32_016287 [Rhizopus arrhizus]KAG1432955.1 hypothetical protein G6F57_022547 [Rhizopus arrhizus]KAG1486601.1 hypothetical protein G6F53_013931 [Rhizopus delemar]
MLGPISPQGHPHAYRCPAAPPRPGRQFHQCPAAGRTGRRVAVHGDENPAAPADLPSRPAGDVLGVLGADRRPP